MAELTNPHDRFFKELLAHSETARDFLIHYLPAEVLELLDTSHLEMAKASFVDAELREYLPEYRYGLCDLSAYADAQLKGDLLLQVGLLALKYIFHAELRERLPSLVGLLRELQQRETPVEYIQMVLRYLTQATDRITEEDLRKVMQKVFPEGEALMGTIAEKWIEQGKQLGLDEGLQQGLEQGLERGLQKGLQKGLLDGIELALELRFGADGLGLFGEIAKIENVDVLKAIHAGIKQANSANELRLIYRNE